MQISAAITENDVLMVNEDSKNIFGVIWCVAEKNSMQISDAITEKLISIYVVQLAYR